VVVPYCVLQRRRLKPYRFPKRSVCGSWRPLRRPRQERNTKRSPGLVTWVSLRPATAPLAA
jgi:hypothetical protein